MIARSLPPIALLCLACGAPPRTDPAPPKPTHPAFEPAPFSAEGVGGSRAAAILDAKQAISAQLRAEIHSETQAQEREINGVSSAEAARHIRVTTRFEHAELIRVEATFERAPGVYVAHARLDRTKAIARYRADIEALHAEIERARPALLKAIAEADPVILLAGRYDAPAKAAEAREKGRVLEVLGARPPRLETDVGALEAQLGAARRALSIHLQLEGAAPLARKLESRLEAALGRRGCQLVEPPEEGVEPLPARLKVETRRREELGVLWQYIGFELVIRARDGRQVFRGWIPSQDVHGGGPTWEKAEAAALRRLEARMEEIDFFDGLRCR